MVEYSICESDNDLTKEHVLVIPEDAVLHVYGNCKVKGQIILAESCHNLRIVGDTLTVITQRKDIALGRRPIHHGDGTYSVSSSPLKIIVDCKSIKLRSGIFGLSCGVFGNVDGCDITFTKNCENRDIPMSAKPSMRFLPGTDKSYCPPSYENDALILQRANTAGITYRWDDTCRDFVLELVACNVMDVKTRFLNMCYAKLFMEHTAGDCERVMTEWFAIVTNLLWAYQFYRNCEFDYSLIRMSWLYAYKLEYINYVHTPQSIKYMLATDMFYEKHCELTNTIDVRQFLSSCKDVSNDSKLQVTNHGIVLRNIQVMDFAKIVETAHNDYNIVARVMGGHTHFLSTYGQSDKYCFASVDEDIYEQFMASMDLPTNERLPLHKTEELEMTLDYLKYMSTNIPAPAMREQLPELLMVTAKLLGFDEHKTEHGVNLMALWKDYIKHVDSSATEYMEVIEDYLHRVPRGSVSDEQVCELYKSCVEKLQDMVDNHAQCSFLFTASYSYEMANKMDKESSAYAVYMWQACVALAQALLVATNINIARLAPVDLFSQVNAYYHKDFKCTPTDEAGYEAAYKALLEFGRSINWGM